MTRRNIELKARLPDPAAARRQALAVATEHGGVLHQRDTYFHCKSGRLKLRESDDGAQLIWYARDDLPQAKAGNYHLVPLADAAAVKGALAAALGIRAVVEKRRELFLFHNVRIHLDHVEGLGDFLEFEAVLQPGVDDQQGHAQLAELSEHFGIAAADLVPISYGDMLASDAK